jgi:hypothetical protein
VFLKNSNCENDKPKTFSNLLVKTKPRRSNAIAMITPKAEL